MQKKNVFVSNKEKPYVTTYNITCDLPKGFAVSQKQKGIVIVHDTFMHTFGRKTGVMPLEISSKSTVDLGVKLSAFNLKNAKGQTVECIFQGSKHFENGNVYSDLLDKTSKEAKKDERLRNSGKLVCFTYNGVDYPLDPTTAFYDWIYIKTLFENDDLVKELDSYVVAGAAFTDIEFNPNHSLNCQAKAIALYVGMKLAGIELDKDIEFDKFVELAY